MKISTLSIDLAKQVFQVLGMDSTGKPVLSKRVNRDKLTILLHQTPHCTVVMESCATAHYWGRLCERIGHTVKLIPAQHVTPFVRGNKNDKNDCMAIYEASHRPHLRCVPVKSEDQQATLLLHRQRERLIQQRTQCINQTRGLLLEFGYVVAKTYQRFRQSLITLKDDKHLHPAVQEMLISVSLELNHLDERLRTIEVHFRHSNQAHPSAQILQSIPGVGHIIASAFSASIDKGQAFSNSRELGVWLGLTPSQYASGSVNRMGSITKRGDGYLRKQLIHGARTVVMHAHKKDDDLNRWIIQLKQRIGYNKTVVATAHRLARLMWVLLQKQIPYQAQYQISQGQPTTERGYVNAAN